MTVLYERDRDDGPDPEGWTEPPELRATIVRRTRGFGPPHSDLLCGSRGGVPLKGKRPSPGSLADRVVGSGRTEYDEDGGFAAIARPVFWRGRLAKVAVVAVPYHHRAVLEPQMPASGFSNSMRGLAASAPGSRESVVVVSRVRQRATIIGKKERPCHQAQEHRHHHLLAPAGDGAGA